MVRLKDSGLPRRRWREIRLTAEGRVSRRFQSLPDHTLRREVVPTQILRAVQLCQETLRETRLRARRNVEGRLSTVLL